MAIKVKKPLSVVATVHPELAIMRDFLDATIKAGRDFDIELILVNSLSVDIDALISEIPSGSISIDLVDFGFKSQASSILQGIARAKSKFILSIDPDMAGSLYALKEMYALAESGAVVVMTNRRFTSRSRLRSLGGGAFNFIIKRIINVPVSDINSPMFIIKKEMLSQPGVFLLPSEACKLKMLVTARGRIKEIDIIDQSINYNIRSTYGYGSLARLFFVRLYYALKLRLEG